MNCNICHMEHGTRTNLLECTECGRQFCIDCGSHETSVCCECLREEHNKEDIGVMMHTNIDDMLEAVRDGV